MSEPDPVPTSQVTGTTTDNSAAGSAPGTPPSPQDLDVSPHPYRQLQHADDDGGSQPGRWAAPEDTWPGAPA